MARAITIKKTIEVDWNDKKKTLQAGVAYANLPKEVLAQLPKPKAKK